MKNNLTIAQVKTNLYNHNRTISIIMSNQYLKQIDTILKQEVSRSDFIKYTFVALLGVMGVTSFIKNLHKSVSPSPKTTVNRATGYGKSPYGV